MCGELTLWGRLLGNEPTDGTISTIITAGIFVYAGAIPVAFKNRSSKSKKLQVLCVLVCLFPIVQSSFVESLWVNAAFSVVGSVILTWLCLWGMNQGPFNNVQ